MFSNNLQCLRFRQENRDTYTLTMDSKQDSFEGLSLPVLWVLQGRGEQTWYWRQIGCWWQTIELSPPKSCLLSHLVPLELELWSIVSHPMGSRNWTWVLCKGSWLLNHLQTPVLSFEIRCIPYARLIALGCHHFSSVSLPLRWVSVASVPMICDERWHLLKKSPFSVIYSHQYSHQLPLDTPKF